MLLRTEVENMNNQGEKKTILVIEDEKILQQALSTKLVHEGFAVITADNGEDGLAIALAKHPDLILLDIIMPKMNGITTAQKLATDAWGKTVPIIILTNLSDELKLTENFPKNVVDYLVKSDWEIGDIAGKIKEKLHIS